MMSEVRPADSVHHSSLITHHSSRLTPLQRRVLLLVATLVALTRFLAVAHSLNDWDEALFSLGVAEYDINFHHPHPPGYPLFVLAAKAIHLLGVNEFRSLQVIVLLGSFLLFPAVVLFARECGFGFATAVCGALLFSFLPNVWIYSGTAFSDIPATAMGFIACWLLLRGRRDGRAYLLGAIVLGIAAGMRVPNLLIGAAPALVATVHRLRARDFRNVILATLFGGVIAAGSYLGAALASGTIEQYRFMLREQSKYVREVDSWRNPGRPPLHEVAKSFFLRPVQQKAQWYGIAILGLISLLVAAIQRRGAPWLTFAIFAPFAITAWLNLDVGAAGRYAIPYLAGYALLLADALSLIARRRARVQAVLASMIVVMFIVWTWPALTLQRTSEPPPMAALHWVERNVPQDTLVYLSGGVGPQADYVVPERQTYWNRPEDVSALAGDAWILDLKIVPGAHNFVWPHSNPLWKILRRRNFEASIARVSSFIRFDQGWHNEEGSGTSTFRWMPATATATLPALNGKGKLHLKLYVPIDTLPAPPQIEVMVNGTVIERFTGSPAVIEKSWILESRKGAVNELRISTSAVVNPAKLGNSTDSRDLGLRVDGLSWTPVD
jgi:hypothetical protein